MVELVYEPFDWAEGQFNYPNMVKIPVIQNSSSLLHAIAASYFRPYRLNRYDNGEPYNRTGYIQIVRNDLAERLGTPININDDESPTYYDVMGGGIIRDLSNTKPEYTLESLQNILKSNKVIGNTFFEFIGDSLKRDL